MMVLVYSPCQDDGARDGACGRPVEDRRTRSQAGVCSAHLSQVPGEGLGVCGQFDVVLDGSGIGTACLHETEPPLKVLAQLERSAAAFHLP
jgi:hypothetical protein